jgi:hypothetical protein
MVKSSMRPGFSVPTGVAQYRARLILLGTLATGLTASGQPTTLPVKLENFIKSAGGLSRQERTLLLAGQPVTKLLDADAGKEVAVLGAIRIDAAIHRYVEAVKNIETFESGGGFKVTS